MGVENPSTPLLYMSLRLVIQSNSSPSSSRRLKFDEFPLISYFGNPAYCGGREKLSCLFVSNFSIVGNSCPDENLGIICVVVAFWFGCGCVSFSCQRPPKMRPLFLLRPKGRSIVSHFTVGNFITCITICLFCIPKITAQLFRQLRCTMSGPSHPSARQNELFPRACESASLESGASAKSDETVDDSSEQSSVS